MLSYPFKSTMKAVQAKITPPKNIEVTLKYALVAPLVNSLLIGKFFILFCQLFQKIISGKPSECQTVWIQIRPDILFGLIWVQTVCKGY